MNFLNYEEDKLDYKARNALESAGINIIERSKLKNQHNKINIIFSRFGTKFDKKTLKKFTNLKYFLTPTTGKTHIDLDYLNLNKVQLICLLDDYNKLQTIPASSEFTLMLIFMLLKKVRLLLEHDVNKNLYAQDIIGNDLKDKTVGIIGFGRNGKKLCEYLKPFEVDILFYDPYVNSDHYATKSQSINKLVIDSDIVVLTLISNDETFGIINRDVLSNFNNSKFLINTSRGEIIDQDCIAELLNNKSIAGYASDVLSLNEHNNKKLIDCLKSNDNLILTPHVAGNTIESRQKADLIVINKFLKDI